MLLLITYLATHADFVTLSSHNRLPRTFSFDILTDAAVKQYIWLNNCKIMAAAALIINGEANLHISSIFPLAVSECKMGS